MALEQRCELAEITNILADPTTTPALAYTTIAQAFHKVNDKVVPFPVPTPSRPPPMTPYESDRATTVRLQTITLKPKLPKEEVEKLFNARARRGEPPQVYLARLRRAGREVREDHRKHAEGTRSELAMLRTKNSKKFFELARKLAPEDATTYDATPSTIPNEPGMPPAHVRFTQDYEARYKVVPPPPATHDPYWL